MKTPVIATLAFLAATIAPARAAITAFSDTFDYTGWSTGATPANAVWSRSTASGSGGTIVNGNNANFSGAHRFDAAGVINADFSQVATGDFTLTLDLMTNGYGRYLWVGVFNADGTHGYGFNWDTGNETSYGGQGSLALREFTSGTANPNYTYNTSGTLLTSLAASGYKISDITAPISFRLTWREDTRTLALALFDSVSGTYVEKRTHTLAESADLIESFSRLYIGGNGGSTGVLFDNILATSSIPEPSSAALLGGLAAGLLSLSRRRRA